MRFVKMHGIGNDYIFIDATKEDLLDDLSVLSIVYSNRHFGIGGDGVVVIGKSIIADFSMRIFNSDGSEAQMCGNAIRCVGKYVYDYKLIDSTYITVQTKSGVKKLWLNVLKGKVDSVRVDMGQPITDPKLIPTTLSADNLIYYPMMIKRRLFDATVLSMGNPHCVIIGARPDDETFYTYSPLVQYHSAFPSRVNVIWTEVLDRSNISVRVYERGVGETLACGTGASAAAVATMMRDLTDKKVNVALTGGNLVIEWSDSVYMTGSATLVYEGNTVD